jgi:hypothetical protein
MEEIKITAVVLFEFTSFEQWVNKASSWFRPYKYGFSYICLDKNNKACHIGADFMKARDTDAFPVKVYAIERTENKLLESIISSK